MIGVGINENVILNASIDPEKNRLSIELSELGTGGDLFTQMTQTGYTATSGTMKLNILSVLAPKADNKKSVDQNIQIASADISNIKNQLTQILALYMSIDSIDLGAVAYNGTGIVDSATFRANILRQDVLNLIYTNMINRFVQLFNALGGIPSQTPVRFKLQRQSKDKHYADIPKRNVDKFPFVELMTVPAEASKVAFSKYEIENGLNDGTPVDSAKAEKKPVPGAPGAPVPPAFAAPVPPAVNAFAAPAPAPVPAFAAPAPQPITAAPVAEVAAAPIVIPAPVAPVEAIAPGTIGGPVFSAPVQ